MLYPLDLNHSSLVDGSTSELVQGNSEHVISKLTKLSVVTTKRFVRSVLAKWPLSPRRPKTHPPRSVLCKTQNPNILRRCKKSLVAHFAWRRGGSLFLNSTLPGKCFGSARTVAACLDSASYLQDGRRKNCCSFNIGMLLLLIKTDPAIYNYLY